MEVMQLVLALLLPWWLGVSWLRRIWSEHNPAVWPMILGYGYILGMLFITLLLQLWDRFNLTLDFFPLALLCLLFIALSYVKRGSHGHSSQPSRLFPFLLQSRAWQRYVFVIVLIILSVRFAGLIVETYWHPLIAWDGWSTWAVRPIVWFEYKQLIPFVAPDVWLAGGEQTQYTMDAWRYPVTVSLIPLWTTLAYGQWHEGIAFIPWWLCGIALGLGFYGQARLWDMPPWQGLLFTYILLSLPLLNVHITLVGYADLWMATVYSFAVIAFIQWVRSGDWRQGLLALLLALICPFIKLEGLLWLLTLLLAGIVAWGWRRPLFWLLFIVFLGVSTVSLVKGISFEIAGLGLIQLGPDAIQLPYLGRLGFGFFNNWQPVYSNLLLLFNWHLLWYLATIIVLIALPKIILSRYLFAYTLTIATGFGLLFVLFFLTVAQLWAKDYTSINRLFLHFTPAVIFYLAILVKAVTSADTKQLSAGQSS